MLLIFLLLAQAAPVVDPTASITGILLQNGLSGVVILGLAIAYMRKDAEAQKLREAHNAEVQAMHAQRTAEIKALREECAAERTRYKEESDRAKDQRAADMQRYTEQVVEAMNAAATTLGGLKETLQQTTVAMQELSREVSASKRR